MYDLRGGVEDYKSLFSRRRNWYNGDRYHRIFWRYRPEGFAIYYELKTQYASYSIRLKREFYEKILEAVRGSERKPGKIRGKIQNRAREVLPSALQEFDTETADFLQRMMLKDLCYIPQEALILVGEAEVENTTRRIRSNGVT